MATQTLEGGSNPRSSTPHSTHTSFGVHSGRVNAPVDIDQLQATALDGFKVVQDLELLWGVEAGTNQLEGAKEVIFSRMMETGTLVRCLPEVLPVSLVAQVPPATAGAGPPTLMNVGLSSLLMTSVLPTSPHWPPNL